MTRMPATRAALARRLGLEPNPLRRRCDIIQAWLVPAAAVLFLILSPLAAWLAVTVVHEQAQRAGQSARPVPAVLQRAAPGPARTDHGANTWTEWEPATWTAGGRQHTAQIPVPAGSEAGSRQQVWLDRAGHLLAPPPSAAQVSGSQDTAALLAVCVAAIMVVVAAGLVRRGLDRRRIASWETAWLAVGPRWSHQR